MSLLAMERIKLFSTRSPYWCLAAILVAGVSFGMLISLVAMDGTQLASTASSQAGMQFGLMIFLVLATLAITTEYRFATIRTTFLTVPHRTAVFAAKTAVVAVLGAVIAVVTGLAAFFLIKVLAHDSSRVALETGAQWRLVVGSAATYALARVIALAVGALIRQSAGAIALLLVWTMLVESLVGLIPRVGADISAWLPFSAGSAFTTDYSAYAGMAEESGTADLISAHGPTPWQGLAVFAATALVLWLVAALVINRRDA